MRNQNTWILLNPRWYLGKSVAVVFANCQPWLHTGKSIASFLPWLELWIPQISGWRDLVHYRAILGTGIFLSVLQPAWADVGVREGSL